MGDVELTGKKCRRGKRGGQRRGSGSGSKMDGQTVAQVTKPVSAELKDPAKPRAADDSFEGAWWLKVRLLEKMDHTAAAMKGGAAFYEAEPPSSVAALYADRQFFISQFVTKYNDQLNEMQRKQWSDANSEDPKVARNALKMLHKQGTRLRFGDDILEGGAQSTPVCKSFAHEEADTVYDSDYEMFLRYRIGL